MRSNQLLAHNLRSVGIHFGELGLWRPYLGSIVPLLQYMKGGWLQSYL